MTTQNQRPENIAFRGASCEPSISSFGKKGVLMKTSFLGKMMFVCLITFFIGCSGKSTSIEGKLVDGKTKPLANVKVAAKMSQPIKGYEQFETTTGADGSFKFSRLFPTSEYKLIFYPEKWDARLGFEITTGPEGQIKKIPQAIMIRFKDLKEGVVLDTMTDLMWASHDNGSNINWQNAKSYCEKYRGGGYADWRMPTPEEVMGLYGSDVFRINIKLTAHNNDAVIWTSKDIGGDAIFFFTNSGEARWVWKSYDMYTRALPVRSNK